ncbi:hypothetical protein VNI00_008802 [Paramarasmius palmivorus]|uniref:Nephrocystin 3-like N-terminal domain-containing protein n=1 Tax=Paramarasmius palmivorus TaxID=297713 RepID=A0AAW0CY13_9AGAR
MNACLNAEARYPPPNCHPNTRVNTLKKLGQWIRDNTSPARVCWVHGAAGVGKSAIAQRVSEDHPDRLCAAFFFSRNDGTRDKLDPFVATLAYQCCTLEPLRTIVASSIIEAIRSHPNIFKTSAENQFQKLLLEPFSRIPQASRRMLPNLIVVDGLDECINHSSQRRLLGILDLAITFSAPDPFPFIFLLCSRPELQIRNGIDDAAFASCLDQIQISSATIRITGELTESDLDIQRYFLEKFTWLRRKYHGVLRTENNIWPSEDVVMDLVQRASGQFIFAVTVIDYIDTLEARPQDRLKAILSEVPAEIPSSPYPALDMLYRQILSACQLHWQRLRPILRLLLTHHPPVARVPRSKEPKVKPHSPHIIAGLFQLESGEVEMFLLKLHSVIHVPDNPEEAIHILHASFTEFLLDNARSGDYNVLPYSREEYCDLAAVFLLRTLSSYAPFYPLSSLASDHSFSAAFIRWQGVVSSIKNGSLLEIASGYWSEYCCQLEAPSGTLLAQLDGFDPYTVGALTLVPWDPTYILQSWRTCLHWAKSLGEKAPRIFIRNMEAFLCEFCMGYSRGCPRRHVINDTFEVEYGLAASNGYTKPGFHLVTRMIDEYYRQWWGENPAEDLEEESDMDLEDGSEEVNCALRDRRVYPLLFSTTSHPGIYRDLSGDWVVVRISEKNGGILRRMYHVYRSLDKDARKALNGDIVDDTSESVGRNLVKGADLAEFKALLYERRDLFANMATMPHRRFLPRLRPRNPIIPFPRAIARPSNQTQSEDDTALDGGAASLGSDELVLFPKSTPIVYDYRADPIPSQYSSSQHNIPLERPSSFEESSTPNCKIQKPTFRSIVNWLRRSIPKRTTSEG